MGKFLINPGANNQFYFSLKADNGQNILKSEGYSTKAACNNGIESVKKNAGDDSNFERKASSNGKHYFNLNAGNGQTIGTSGMYESEAGMENGIESVKTNATAAVVVVE